MVLRRPLTAPHRTLDPLGRSAPIPASEFAEGLAEPGCPSMESSVESIDPSNAAAPTRDEAFIAAFARFVERVLVPWHRFECGGLENVPLGPALYVSNHSGSMNPVDSWLVPAAIHRTYGLTEVPFGLAHDGVLKLPVVGAIARRFGMVPANHASAHRIFAHGLKAIVYPGGELDANRPFRARHAVRFDGRTGFIRCALRERVPIVPIATAGAQSTFVVLSDGQPLARFVRAPQLLRMKVWPVTLSLPWGLTIGPTPPHLPWPATIRSELLAPIVLPDVDPDDRVRVGALAEEVRSLIEATVVRLAREIRQRSPFGRAATR